MKQKHSRLAALPLLLVFIPWFVPMAQAGTGPYADDFEDDELLAPPTGLYSRSTSGTGGFYVSQVNPSNTPQNYRHYYAGGTGINTMTSHFTYGGASLDNAVVNFCKGGVIDIWVRFDAAGTGTSTATGTTYIMFTNSGAGKGFGVYLAGSTQLWAWAEGGSVGGTGSSTSYRAQALLKGDYVLESWVHLQFKAINCGGALFTVVIPEEELVASVDSGGSIPSYDSRYTGGSNDNYDVGVTNRLTFVTGDAKGGAFDDIKTTSGGPDAPVIGPEPPPVVGAAETVGVTNLVGFAVDRGGNNIIARTQSGAGIEAYNAYSLLGVGSATSTCNRVDGVAAIATHLAYADCDDTGKVTEIKIRSPQLGSPEVKDGCDQECPKDVSTDTSWPDAIVVPTNLQQLGFMSTWNMVADSKNSWSIIFSLSTTDGKAGAWGVIYNNNGPDSSDLALATYDSTSTPQLTQMCGWHTSDGRDVIGAVTENGASKWYEVNALYKFNPPFSEPDIRLIGPILSNSAALGGAFGVACASGRAVVQNAAGVWIVSVGGGQAPSIEHGPIPVTAPQVRGVALSDDGKYLAWVDGTQVKIADASTGNVTGTITHPDPGAHKQMAMDAAAQNLWIATSTLIARYEVFPVTTIDPVADVPTTQFGAPDTDTTTDTPTAGELPGIRSRFSPTVLFVLSLVTIGGSGALAYKLAGPAPMVVGGAAVLGIAASVYLWSFPVWVVITIAAGGIATFAAKMANRVGGARA